jgi:hypothetical protein
MGYAVELELGSMVYIPNFIKTVFEIEKLIGGIHRQTA